MIEMVAMRVFWLALTALGVSKAVFNAQSPVAEIAMGCAKIGEFGVDSTVQCDDPIVDVYGVWRLIVVGLAVSVPPLTAAVFARRTVWWGAVAALAVVGLIALFNLGAFWFLLIVALPLAAVALVAVLLDSALRKPQPRSASGRGVRITRVER